MKHLYDSEKMGPGLPNYGQGYIESTQKSTTLNFALNDVLCEPKGHRWVEVYLLKNLTSRVKPNQVNQLTSICPEMILKP